MIDNPYLWLKEQNIQNKSLLKMKNKIEMEFIKKWIIQF